MNARSSSKNNSPGGSSPETNIKWDELQLFAPLRTKLSVPPIRSGWISRPRLDKRMDEGFARKLTLLPELQLVIVEYYDSDLNWDDPGSDGFELTMLILDARLDK